jgi:transposase-like protein
MVERKDSAVAAVAARRHWRKDDARLVVDAWRQSGQTITAFARFYDIHPERLARWHRLLRAEPQQAVRFHPVRVQGTERHRVESVDKIELVLSEGRSIRVPHGFDPEDLRRLLAVVEASA